MNENRRKKISSSPLSSSSGFTLPEILVVVSLLSIFSLSLYSIYIGGIRSFKSGSDRSEALQAASLVYQTLVYDFKRAVFDTSHPIKVSGNPGTQLEFHVLSDSSPSWMGTPTKRITYEFQPDSNSVKRNDRTLSSGRIKNLSFIMHSPSNQDSSPPSLSFQITAEGSHAESDERDEITLNGGLGIPAKTTRQKFPTWKPHPGFLTP